MFMVDRVVGQLLQQFSIPDKLLAAHEVDEAFSIGRVIKPRLVDRQ